MVVLVTAVGCGQTDSNSLKSDVLARLEGIKNQRKSELLAYFDRLRQKAHDVTRDKTMLQYFRLMQREPGKITSKAASLRMSFEVDRHYANNYGDFYDLLFIDTTGYVFHSIRQESDYHTNLIIDAPQTGIARHLRKGAEAVFVDYEYYDPSEEPAAFELVPIAEDGRQRGWIVFQYAINSVNNLLTDRRGLGRTGEVYLVNSNNLMLSDSRFTAEGTILRKQVGTAAAEQGFADSIGNGIIRDYRGVTVFSSFERIDRAGVSWVIIAEIDEDEVITDLYSQNSEQFAKRVINHLSSLSPCSKTMPIMPGDTVEVDMNEAIIGRPGQVLLTRGVATCTAVSVSFPGRFSALAHLVPTDASYSDWGTGIFLETRLPDLLDELMVRIERYEIYPYELGNLKFTIAANHDGAIPAIIDKLLEKNITVSQIRIIFNSPPWYANVAVDSDEGKTVVEWVDPDGADSFFQSDTQSENLGTIVKNLIGYNSIGVG